MICTVALSTLLLSAPTGGRELVDRIVAVVNEDVITLSELKRTATAYMRGATDPEQIERVHKTTLDNLIADKLLSQQVKEAKISVTPEDVDKAIDDIVRQNRMTREQLRQAVETRGMDMAQYRSDLESQIVRLKLIDLKVRSRVVVPESDIKVEYERRTSKEEREELLTLRHLFFRWGESPDPAERERVRTRANAARDRLLAGEDFAAVAKEISEGPTAGDGGLLGEIGRGGLLPELARAVAGLPVMKVSGLIDTANGVHVVRVDSIRKTEPTAYSELRPEIYQRLYQGEVERQMKEWIDDLRAQAAIDVRL